VYAYYSEGLADVFDEMAREWRGWSGCKHWESLEGELKLSFTADGKGHVTVAIQLSQSLYPDSWRVQATSLIEAGQLDELANSMRQFLEQGGRAA